MMMPLALVPVAVTLLLSAPSVQAVCECGYRMSDSGTLFTNFLNNTFANVPDTTDRLSVINSLPDWQVQEGAIAANPSDGAPLGRQNEAANIWVKDGELHLREPGWNGNGNVSTAELHSQVTDILHGSFRMLYRVQQDDKGKGGAVAGFFYYYNDSSETDIELVTNDGLNSVRYTNHPSVDTTTGDVINGTSFKDPLTQPWTTDQEQRFDWVPGVSRFYQENVLKQEIRKSVPTHEGTIMINMWSNGGSWSGFVCNNHYLAPSTTNVTMSISYINLYYNTTASDVGTDSAFTKACTAAGGPSTSKKTICTIDEDNKSTVAVTSDAVSRRNTWLMTAIAIVSIAACV